MPATALPARLYLVLRVHVTSMRLRVIGLPIALYSSSACYAASSQSCEVNHGHHSQTRAMYRTTLGGRPPYASEFDVLDL